MSALRNDISNWFNKGKKEGYAYLIIALDTYDYNNYPVFCKDKEEALKWKSEVAGKNMVSYDEIYNLNEDKYNQMDMSRCNAL